MQGQKGSKRIEMIIKMISEFNPTVVHFVLPIRESAQTRWTARGFTAGQKTVENQDWDSGPPGCRGPWAAGLLLTKPLKTWFELFSSQRTVRVIVGLSYRG